MSNYGLFSFKKATDLLDKYNVHPLIGVIPECQDEELLIEEYHSDFWNYIKELEKKDIRLLCMGLIMFMIQKQEVILIVVLNQNLLGILLLNNMKK